MARRKERAVRSELLEQIIEKVLQQSSATFEDFIKLLEAEKCEYKGSCRSVRLPGKKGFLRLDTLSEDYTEDAIKTRIAGLRSAPKTKTATADAPRSIAKRHCPTAKEIWFAH